MPLITTQWSLGCGAAIVSRDLVMNNTIFNKLRRLSTVYYTTLNVVREQAFFQSWFGGRERVR